MSWYSVKGKCPTFPSPDIVRVEWYANDDDDHGEYIRAAHFRVKILDGIGTGLVLMGCYDVVTGTPYTMPRREFEFVVDIVLERIHRMKKQTVEDSAS